jgi:hypothetical protein
LLLPLGLFLTSQLNAFDRRYLSICVTVGLSALGLLVVQNFNESVPGIAFGACGFAVRGGDYEEKATHRGNLS